MLTPQIVLKLTQLFVCDTSSRFNLMFQAELPSQFIYNINLEGSPQQASMAVQNAFRRYSDSKLEEKLIAYVETQPIPGFIQEYLDKGNR